MCAEEDAAGQKQPGHHGPAAGNVNPLLARVAHHEGAEGKREGHAKAHVPQIKHGRMDHHLRILQQGIQSEAIGGRLTLHQGKRRRGKVEQEQEEDLDAGQDGGSVSGEGDVDLMPQSQDEPVGGQQPRPEQQRPFLAGPQGGELIGSGEGAVGMMKDVGDGEIVGKGGVDQGYGGAGDGKKASDAGAPGGFS